MFVVNPWLFNSLFSPLIRLVLFKDLTPLDSRFSVDMVVSQPFKLLKQTQLDYFFLKSKSQQHSTHSLSITANISHWPLSWLLCWKQKFPTKVGNKNSDMNRCQIQPVMVASKYLHQPLIVLLFDSWCWCCRCYCCCRLFQVDNWSTIVLVNAFSELLVKWRKIT